MMPTTMAPGMLQQVMKDTAVVRSLELAATMVGLPNDTVTTIAEVGLPLMAKMADDNPLVFKTMYAQSIRSLPEPLRLVYAKLARNPKARRTMVEQFTSTYGPLTEAVNRETARQTRVTEAQASEVLAATMPTLVKALGKANTRKNEMGFGRKLRDLNAE